MKGLHEYDYLLIVAGAGLSVKDSTSLENVYVDKEHFRHHYSPFVRRYPQYTTGYECMGLLSDTEISFDDKWTLFWKPHMENMRWKFEPNEAYAKLLELASGMKDYFVLTSNVDGCFVRSGFSEQKIYTPQGDWSNYQCTNACSQSSVWPSKPMLDKEPFQVPKCASCGANCFGNVRGGSWFIHEPYAQQQQRLRQFIDKSSGSLLIIEIGAGFNTPTVTRFVSESVAKIHKAPLVRINPEYPAVPQDLLGFGVKGGWQALENLEATLQNGVSVVDPANRYHKNPNFHYKLFLDHLL